MTILNHRALTKMDSDLSRAKASILRAIFMVKALQQVSMVEQLPQAKVRPEVWATSPVQHAMAEPVS